MVRAWLVTLVCLLVACADIGATNPYDPQAPAGQQAHGLIRGRLVVPDGFDLAQAVSVSVMLTPADRPGGEPLAAVPTVTEGEDRGRFVFDDVVPGTYSLLPLVPTLVGGERVLTVEIGAELDLGDVALRLEAAPERLRTLEGVAMREGAAADGHGGITVRLNGTPYSTSTVGDGSFALVAPPRLYDLTFQASGYGTTSLTDVRLTDDDGPTRLDEPVILVAQPGSVRGVVSAPGLTSPETRLPEAQVELWREGAEAASQTTRPDAAGAFVVPDIGVGAWSVRISLDGFAPLSVPFDLGPGEAADLRQLVLSPAADGHVEGHAFLDGAPDGGHADIHVLVGGRAENAWTQPDGAFALSLPAGLYRLRFVKDGYAEPAPVEVAIEAGATTTVEPSPVLAARDGRIAGTVALADVTAPDPRLGEVGLALTSTLDGQTTVLPAPADTGLFGFATPPGDYLLAVSCPGFASVTLPVSVGPGATLDLGRVDLAAAPPGRLAGTVRLAGAAPDRNDGIRISVVGRAPFTETAPDGSFTLELPADRYDLTFSRAGYGGDGAQGIVVAPGEVTRLPRDYVLAADPGGLRGLVRLPPGYEDPARLAAVAVELYPVGVSPDAAPPTASTGPRPDGSFQFDGVPVGDWRVDAVLHDDADFEGASRTGTVAPGRVTDLDLLQIRPASLAAGELPATIVGRANLQGVVDEAGHGGIVVTIAGTPLSAVTGADGRFQIQGVPTGEPLDLSFQRDGYGQASAHTDGVGREETHALAQAVILTRLPGEVRGQVTLDRFGSPAALATTSATLAPDDGSPPFFVDLDAEGHFQVRDVTAGDYTLTVTAIGYRTETRPVTVRLAQRTDLGDVLLRHESETEAAVSFGGTVTLAGVVDHSGTQVHVRFADRDVALATTLTDAAGHFTVPASPRDRYVFEVEHPGYAPLSHVGPFTYRPLVGGFEDEQGEAPAVSLVLSPLDGRIRVTFSMTPDWIPGPQQTADIRLYAEGFSQGLDDVRAGTPTDFGGLVAGAYFVRVQRPGFETFEQLVVLGVGRTRVELNDVALPLRSLAAANLDVSGQVLGPDTLTEDISLVGADLAGVHLSGDFSGRDFTGARLSNAMLDGVVLRGATLVGASLFGASLVGADLSDVNGALASFLGADLSGANLERGAFSGANFTGARLVGAVFVPANTPEDQLPAPPCAPLDPARRVVDVSFAQFGGADLSRAEMVGISLASADLSGARLRGTLLHRACLTRTGFVLTDLSEADLTEADLTHANLVNAVMQDTQLQGANLNDANGVSAVLQGARFDCRDLRDDGACVCVEPFDSLDDDQPAGAATDCRGKTGAAWRAACGCRTHLERAQLNGANLIGAQMAGADLRGASLVGITFGDGLSPPPVQPTDCNLPEGCTYAPDAACVQEAARACRVTQTRLDGARLDEAELSGVGLNHVDLTGASLRGAGLGNASFFANSRYLHADLTGADLSGATLRGVDLRGVDLTETNLTGAVLTAADLRGVRVAGARLENTDFTGTRVRGADFSGVHVRGTFNLWQAPDFLDEGRVEMAGADLEGTNVDWLTQVTGVVLDGANVRRTTQTDPRTPVRGVSLRDVEFGDPTGRDVPAQALVTFDNCELSGATFHEFGSIRDSRVRGAIFAPRAFAYDLTPSLTRSDLSGARFEESEWQYATLSLNLMRDVVFAGGHFYGSTFTLNDLDGADLSGARFEGANNGADETFSLVDLGAAARLPAALVGLTMRGVDARNADFAGVDLTGTQWLNGDVRGARLGGVRVQGTQFQNTLVEGADATGASLAGATLLNIEHAAPLVAAAATPPVVAYSGDHRGQVGLGQAELAGGGRDANYARLVAPNAHISGTLLRVNLQASRLAGSTFTFQDNLAAYYDGPQFAFADLTGARFSGQTGRNFSFRQASLLGADFEASLDLYEADFTDARFAAAGEATVPMPGQGGCRSCLFAGEGTRLLEATAGDLTGSDFRAVALPSTVLEGRHATDSTFAGWVVAPGTVWRDNDFSGSRFFGARFPPRFWVTRDVLANARFTDASMHGAELYADLRGATLTCADLSGAYLPANLTGAQAWGCLDLSGAQVDLESRMPGFSLKGTRLDRAAFSNTIETLGKDLAGNSMRGANLFNCDLTGTIMNDVDLTGASLASMFMDDLQAEGLEAPGVTFDGGTFRRARFAFANLAGAVFRPGDLFADLDLTEADFHGADLSNADLRAARIGNAHFAGADVTGTHLCASQVPTLRPGYLGQPDVDPGC